MKKKGPKVGSGGQRRRGLEGKGPTPKAEDRVYHPAHQRKKERERREAARAAREKSRELPGKIRPAEDAEIIAGRNAAVEAVRAGIPLTQVFLAGAAANDERVSEILRTATALNAPVHEVSRSQLDRITDGAVHQGIAIESPPYEYASIDELVERDTHPGLLIALDSVTDPHNLGAVLRSGCAFGAAGVIIPQRRSASINEAVWKVSAGAAARLPVARVTNLARTLTELKERGYFIVGTAGDGEVSLPDLELYDMPLVIVTGSEGRGLSRLVAERCDQLVSIPITGVESLNAAVATGVVLYDIARRRKEQS